MRDAVALKHFLQSRSKLLESVALVNKSMILKIVSFVFYLKG